MVHQNAVDSYQKAQVYDEINPNKLILMLYEGAIKRVNLARDGIKKSNPQQRGENIGKAIAIISELNACLDAEVKTEEVNFLRSLYMSMLVELPKASLNNDATILDRTEKYLLELKRIWETTVLNSQKNVSRPGAQKLQNPYGSARVPGSLNSIAI